MRWPCWIPVAWRHLRRCPPAITRTIATQEQRVGARLIERTTRSPVPAAAGLALADRSRSLLDLYAEAMLLAARAGFGLARVQSYPVVEDLESGSLVRLLPDFEPAVEPVQIPYSGAGTMRPGARAFVEFAAAYLGTLSVVRD